MLVYVLETEGFEEVAKLRRSAVQLTSWGKMQTWKPWFLRLGTLKRSAAHVSNIARVKLVSETSDP